MIEIGRGGSAASQVVISDVAGRIVRRLDARAGEVVTWDGRSDTHDLLPSGVYFYRLLTPLGESAAQKAILTR
jgi:phosphodiesterase/alkaline phosphatase D-like protein